MAVIVCWETAQVVIETLQMQRYYRQIFKIHKLVGEIYDIYPTVELFGPCLVTKRYCI